MTSSTRSTRKVGPVGVNLRPRYLGEVAELPSWVGFVEVIADNLIDTPALLERAVDALHDVPVSLHCVGLDIGGVDELDRDYLDCLGRAIEALKPIRISDHLCWQRLGGARMNDLMPLPYTPGLIEHAAARIDRIQNALGARLDLENLSYYVEFNDTSLPEHVVLNSLVRATGCGLLLDLANLEVNERNHGVSADYFLKEIDLGAVAELHVAGPELVDKTWIDTHGGEPSEWQGTRCADPRLGHIPVCYERDVNLAHTLAEFAKPAYSFYQARAA